MKTHLDLFSGIGGFAIAAQACGYTTIGFCEKEPYAQQILKERFGAVLADADGDRCGWCDEITSCALQKSATKQEGGIPRCRRPAKNTVRGSCPPILHRDIFQLCGTDYAGVDLLTGGFPCQPFSVAGKRKGAADDRALWPEMLRVIDGAKPAWIIGENVAGIVTMELDNILSDLEGIGYAAWPLVIPACAVDARHRRDRVWIVAHADCGRGEQRDKNERGFSKPDPECAGLGEDVADANGASAQGNECSERSQQERAFTGEHCEWRDEGEWFAESGMGRVAHGIPNRAHSLRGLGNAIVPQVAYEIIRAIPPHIPGREIALAMGAGML
jgi:DNA (cytosine-5)-methyltransferase 1